MNQDRTRAARTWPPTIASLKGILPLVRIASWAKDAGDATRWGRRVLPARGRDWLWISALSGGDGNMLRGRVVCSDELDFRVEMGLGGGSKGVVNDVVVVVSGRGASLKTNDKVWLMVLETGKVIKISDNK